MRLRSRLTQVRQPPLATLTVRLRPLPSTLLNSLGHTTFSYPVDRPGTFASHRNPTIDERQRRTLGTVHAIAAARLNRGPAPSPGSGCPDRVQNILASVRAKASWR
jgi:hypothetical protein